MPRLRGTVYQHFLDIGAVRLIGRRIQSKLDRADDPAVELCRQQYGIARGDQARDFPEEGKRLILRERRHEVDAGAAFDAIDENIGQLIQRAIRNRRFERDYFNCGVHAARSSFDATVASALRR